MKIIFRKTTILLAIVSVILSSSIFTASAATVTRLGFTVNDENIHVNWAPDRSTQYVYANGVKIGAVTTKLARATICKSKTNLTSVLTYDGKAQRTILARVAMEPLKTKLTNGSYYHGFNQYCSVKYTLPAFEDYINYAPSSMPPSVTTSSNWSFSLGGGKKDGASGSLSIGASTTTIREAFKILYNGGSSKRYYQVAYDYIPLNGLGTASKDTNRWLTQEHFAFFMYHVNEKVQTANGPTVWGLTFDVEFGYKQTSSSSWNYLLPSSVKWKKSFNINNYR